MSIAINKKTELITSFNNLVMMLVDRIAQLHPKSYFGIHKDLIRLFIKERPDEPISMFIVHVYSNDTYRKKIKDGDDTFFINKDYKDYGEQNKIIEKIFQFKEIWMSMDITTKSLIKQVMVMLVNRSELYIEVLYNANKHVKTS